nr:MAG TPA: hypothetical protein [Caudoviricetes sp.]
MVAKIGLPGSEFGSISCPSPVRSHIALMSYEITIFSKTSAFGSTFFMYPLMLASLTPSFAANTVFLPPA